MNPAATFEFILLLLVAIPGLELLARRLALPPAAALIAGGIALAFVPGVPAVTLDPELVLVLFLPPLLMDGAYFTVMSEFREIPRLHRSGQIHDEVLHVLEHDLDLQEIAADVARA